MLRLTPSRSPRLLGPRSSSRPGRRRPPGPAKAGDAPPAPPPLGPAGPPPDVDDDDDDEDLIVFTAREAAGAFATVYRFTLPFLKNYKKGVAIVGFGLLVETLFNVIMPLSLKFLIDDALNEEDLQTLYRILIVLAVAGIFTSIVAIWYELWDARTASGIISDARAKMFDHVQNLPAAFFARVKRGEILSRFSVDIAAYESSVKHFANGAMLPFMELIAGIGLMLYLNWQLAAVALLIFPITLIGPRILTPKAVQSNYEQKVNESAILGVVQENVAAQAVVKAFGLQRRALGWFSLAQSRCAGEHDPRDVPLDNGRTHGDDLRAAVALDRAGDRRLSRHHRADFRRHLRHLRKRVLGDFLQYRAPDALHSGGDPGGRGDAAHAGNARRAGARRGPRRCAGYAAHHP